MTTSVGPLMQFYSQAGQPLLWEIPGNEVKTREYTIYLGQQRIARRMTSSLTYIHTDHLGSPLAETTPVPVTLVNSNPIWEPYGAPAGGAFWGGLQFTGHYQDRVTRLTYMQQRYYDPYAGRFLAVDPVATSPGSFNRYWYANNNPYRFYDPDGRDSADRAYGAAVGYMLRNDPEKMRIWAGAEAAATTEGSLAEQGAGMGQAVGEFLDNGDYSGDAVAGLAVKVAATAITKGKYQSGGKFSQSTRKAAAERANSTCEYCGTETVKAKKSEPPRLSRRLQLLRGWSHEDIDEVFARGP